MGEKIRGHIRSNVVGYVALFIALSGTAYATHPGGTNTISTGDIINGEVLSADIRDGRVFTEDIATGGVRSDDVLNDSLTGGDVANESLTGLDVADNSLKGTDVDESTLGQVPVATLGGIGRWTAGGTCNPESQTEFVDCGFVRLNLPAQNRGGGTRVLVIGSLLAHVDDGADLGTGRCRVLTSPPEGLGTPIVASVTEVSVRAGHTENASVMAIAPAVGPGLVDFGIQCNELADGIGFSRVNVTAVAISPT